ncbi:GNAT family N-acetyltransferase [Streptomyces acidiscabies]|uniref:GNAT family N-acetyltransferase n=1 Tax=Streptomyces acidiscabies TaxID=42234 RepID=UPI0038F5F608
MPTHMPADTPTPLPAQIRIRTAVPSDRPLIDRLWLMFRHDLSEFHEVLPFPDGTFRAERVDSAFTAPGWAPYLFLAPDDRPLGFSFVRALDTPTAVMNAFFMVRGARRQGLGLTAALDVVSRHPGPWEVPFQDTNTKAVRFWRRVATAAADSWTEEHREIPGHPDLPPDTWISFDTGAGRRGERA